MSGPAKDDLSSYDQEIHLSKNPFYLGDQVFVNTELLQTVTEESHKHTELPKSVSTPCFDYNILSWSLKQMPKTKEIEEVIGLCHL